MPDNVQVHCPKCGKVFEDVFVLTLGISVLEARTCEAIWALHKRLEDRKKRGLIIRHPSDIEDVDSPDVPSAKSTSFIHLGDVAPFDRSHPQRTRCRSKYCCDCGLLLISKEDAIDPSELPPNPVM